MIGIGSAFKLPGLQKYLGDKLQLEIRKPVEFTRLVGDNVVKAPVFHENLLSYPVAYGLALQGLGVSRLTTSLLPPEITFERKIRAKKPYAVAAAAMLLMGTSIVALGYSVPYGAANDETLKKQMDTSKTVVTRVGTVNNAVKSSIDLVEKAKTEVAAIQAGTEERVNWVDAYRTIDLALPMPGPKGNMNAEGQLELWKTREGLDALKRFEDQIANGVDPKKTVVTDNRSALPMVDVYAIHSRYIPDLKAFYDRVGEESKSQLAADWCGPADLGGLTNDERTKLPEGAGWVFEIRGSTWYNGEKTNVPVNSFLARTLVNNLRSIPRMPTLPKSAANNPNAPKDGQVSHPFLWATFADKEPAARTYKRVPNSLIDYLATVSQTAAASTEGMTPGMPMEPGVGPNFGGMTPGGGSVPAGPQWTPLISGASVGGSSGGPGAMGGPPMMGRPPVMGGPPSGVGGAGSATANPWSPKTGASGATGVGSIGSGPAIMPGTTTTDPAAAKVKVRARSEFVVCFVWKEPTPSDKLISTEVKK